MPSFAEIMADETTAHTFTLLRVAGGMRGKALGILDNLFSELTRETEKYAKLANPNGARYRELEIETGKIIQAAYKVIQKSSLADLERVAVAQDTWANTALNKAVGVNVYTKKLDPRKLELLAAGKVLEGHPLSTWWQGQSEDLRRRFSGEMSKGILLGESVGDLTKRVLGNVTKPDLSTPGLKKKAQRDATALVRTSVMAVSNAAAIESFRNKETVKGMEWLSTLDGRTTIICIGLDGKQWRFPDLEPVGHDKKFPGPIAHVQCRSRQIPVTYTWAELAKKKVPEFDNRNIQQAITQALEDEGEPPEKIAAAISNARASIDGPVKASHTFQSWAENKGAKFITEVIGPGRYELYNAGQITFSDLTNQDNRPLTIKELETAIAGGKIPPETLGRGFIPYTPSDKSAVRVKEIADAARKEAEEAQKRAEENARETLAQLMTEQADRYGGPLTDSRAAVGQSQETDPAKQRELWEQISAQAVPAWLDAWANGQASPHNPDARPNRLRVEAWTKYAKGKPKTLETWKALAEGWQLDKASATVKRAAQEAFDAMARAQAKLEKIQEAITQGSERDFTAAMLDALSELTDAQSKLADALEITD